MGAASLAWKGTENTRMCYFLFHDLCHLLQAFNLLAYMTEIPQVPQGMWSVRPNPLTPQSWKTVHIFAYKCVCCKRQQATACCLNPFSSHFFPIWHVFNGWRKKMKEKELDSMTWNNNMKVDLRWPLECSQASLHLLLVAVSMLQWPSWVSSRDGTKMALQAPSGLRTLAASFGANGSVFSPPNSHQEASKSILRPWRGRWGDDVTAGPAISLLWVRGSTHGLSGWLKHSCPR